MATGSRLAGVAEWPITPEMSGNPGPSSHAQAKGTTSSGRRRRGVNRPDDAPARPAQECGLGATARKTRPLVATGNPCASRMIPLESPVPEIGTPGSESGGRKRTHGCRPAARRESAGSATDPLPATRLPSTLPTGSGPVRPLNPGSHRNCRLRRAGRASSLKIDRIRPAAGARRHRWAPAADLSGAGATGELGRRFLGPKPAQGRPGLAPHHPFRSMPGAALVPPAL